MNIFEAVSKIDDSTPYPEYCYLTVTSNPTTLTLSEPLYNCRLGMIKGFHINNVPIDSNFLAIQTVIPLSVRFSFDNHVIDYALRGTSQATGPVNIIPLYNGMIYPPNIGDNNFNTLFYKADKDLMGNDIHNITVEVYNENGTAATLGSGDTDLKLFLTLILYGSHLKDAALPPKSQVIRNAGRDPEYGKRKFSDY